MASDTLPPPVPSSGTDMTLPSPHLSRRLPGCHVQLGGTLGLNTDGVTQMSSPVSSSQLPSHPPTMQDAGLSSSPSHPNGL